MSRRPSRWERTRDAAITRGGGALLSGLLGSGRTELISGHDFERDFINAREPAIYVLWHGRLLPCSYRYGYAGMGTLISRNRDGDYITRVIEQWGYTVVRGSSSRGGVAALREIVRMLRAGRSVALTPDGPRGPREKMKPGPILAAQLAGVPIIPVSGGASRGRFFGRWDRFLVPAPFAWMPVALGEPYRVARKSGEAELAAAAVTLEERLNRLTLLVDEAARGRR